MVNVDGTNLTRLTYAAARDLYPSWSPNGDKLIFESDRDGGDVDEIYVIKADDSVEARVTRKDVARSLFIFSSEGKVNEVVKPMAPHRIRVGHREKK